MPAGAPRSRPPAATPRTGTRARHRPPTIHKFGGASLADAAAIRHAADLIASASATDGPAVVVVSALAGVTDALAALGSAALGTATAPPDRDEVARGVATLRERYDVVIDGVAPRGAARTALRRAVHETLEEITALLGGVSSLRELTPRTRDFLLSRGEKLSAELVTAALVRAGVTAQHVRAIDLIVTDGVHGRAMPELTETSRRARAVLRPLLAAGVVPVVPGFVGRAPDGTVTTLGRGGTDLSATTLGRVLGARAVHLWKDVPGLLTTDPRLVPDARTIPQLHVREAAELAYYGAKVLHPRALTPLGDRRLPVIVRPFADPEAAGTEISTRRTLSAYPVKALSTVGAQALVTVHGRGMLGVPGVAARLFGALHRAGLSVAIITQASSEQSITVCLPAADARAARTALEAEFAAERARGDIERVELRTPVAMLAVVGLGMAGTPGIAARVFSAVSNARLNVLAIAQGSSELNITLVLDERDAAAAVRAIHDEFQLDRIGGGRVRVDAPRDVVLLGFGAIGRELSRLVPKARPAGGLRIVGVIDRTGYVFDADGLGTATLRTLASRKHAGGSIADAPRGVRATTAQAIRAMASHALHRPILVDLTAHDTMRALRDALTAGFDLVLANKKPLSAPRAEVDALRALADERGRRILFETTVGAGLPVMDTYAKLVESGDRVLRVEGCTSGTLGFLLSAIERGEPFSTAVRAAMAAGYTEPDPRDDLSGMDVARKALILARMLGYTGDLTDVKVESLVPASAAALSRDAFVASLPSLDAEWTERQRAAARQERVLRYVLDVTPKRVTVGLVAVPKSHPLAGLRGTDNQIVFTTPRYKSNPLVITGPGAGPAVTAAGVLNDLLKLVAT